MFTKMFRKEVNKMSFNELFSHVAEECAIYGIKKLIWVNPYFSNSQKQSIHNALTLYSYAKRANLCLKPIH